MGAYVEAWTAGGRSLLPLGEGPATIGKGAESTIVCSDPLVSRLHAVIEPLPGGWCIRDLGSRNGTSVNGERILTQRALRDGDEIGVGGVRIVFRSPGLAPASETKAADPAPELTRAERQVLLALCRPVLSGSLLTEPASVRTIASELVVTESAVKKHLANLYMKFGIHETFGRRGFLANAAIQRGAVSLADLREPT